jgi:hypothetical protein
MVDNLDLKIPKEMNTPKLDGREELRIREYEVARDFPPCFRYKVPPSCN